MDESKIIYHIDEEETPYLMKLSIPPDKLTLGDFKNALNRPNFKFFFKSMDDDFGVVKEEIADDDAHLPCFNGRVVSWLVTADGSAASDNGENPSDQVAPLPGDAPKSTTNQRNGPIHTNESEVESCAESDLVYTTDRVPPLRNFQDYKHGTRKHGSHNRSQPTYDTSSSMMSSDLESTSFFDSEDESSRFSTATGTTMSSVKKYHNRHKKQRRRRRFPPISRASSFSSMTDSTMSLNVLTVTLNMDTTGFLGISIVGQSNKGGDGGIYVGSIMKNGAVAQDGRIEPGDMILEVNSVSFENMSNDDAVRILREEVQKPGPITLVVAKCWDPNPKGYFTIPHQEPVRPIDPRAWVLHTNAMTSGNGAGGLSVPGAHHTGSAITSHTSSSITSSLPESDQQRLGLANEYGLLSASTDIRSIVRSMAQSDSGLEIRDRMWLKITIPNAFIGSDLVDWLYRHVSGFADRRDARKYACNLLKYGYIRHTVNKVTFSEQCYYVFGDLAKTDNFIPAFSQLQLDDLDSVSEVAAKESRHPVQWSSSGIMSGNRSNATYSQYGPLPPRYMNMPGSGPPMSYQGHTGMMSSGPIPVPMNTGTAPPAPPYTTGYPMPPEQKCAQPTGMPYMPPTSNSSGTGAPPVSTGQNQPPGYQHPPQNAPSVHSGSGSSSSSSSRNSSSHNKPRGPSPNTNNSPNPPNPNNNPDIVMGCPPSYQQAVGLLHQHTTNPPPQEYSSPLLGQQGRHVSQVEQEMRSSKQSFRLAMGNPSM